MSVFIFIDHTEGHVKKTSLEALSYGAALATQLGTTAEGILLGTIASDPAKLGRFGIQKIHQAAQESLNSLDAQVYAHIIADIVAPAGEGILVFPNNVTGKAVAPRVAVRLKAGFVSGAIALPDTKNGFVVKKTVFSGKAFANIALGSPFKIIGLNPNAYTVKEGEGSARIVPVTVAPPTPKVRVVSTQKASGEVPLTEAELVVSGGRGLKGPENWGMIEELAHLLGAATACSRPVADAHWRPHNEHVGQTGIAIAPNLYIAIGISGAIQHLAGVNRSKVIVVINKDPEAPFFKAADYGIVGDAFEVVPKMIEAVKRLKNPSS
ncbi:MAG TPA: electron transfer flavoprotein subunit alpha/FixB family protein [Puia sp.]|nr:electron transfer flavoprotein subunit alpha/FixB family protein [Puia sp.]